jgi:peptidoglycan hydrolase-like protein with peptidoglycan-binding domain
MTRDARRVTPRLVALVVGVVLVVPACGDDEGGGGAVTDVDAAQARVSRAETALNESLSTFCVDSRTYIEAIDRYGKAFNDGAATVGDVTTAGADLVAPREQVAGSADAVVAARDELAAAQVDLATAEAGGVEPPPTTLAPLLPAATVERVEQAEEDLATAGESITPDTPVADASAQYNAAAFALEVAWLRLFADAGCLTEGQLADATAAVAEYTANLQTSLQTAELYDGPIDGIYGPVTADAVEALQEASNLPVTGYVDRATADALDAAVAAAGVQEGVETFTQATAVQTTLKLAGYWPGEIDGVWSPELTEALMAMQTDLGVPATGVVDPATLSAVIEAVAAAQEAASTTTTAAPAETTTTAAAASTETTTAP